MNHPARPSTFPAIAVLFSLALFGVGCQSSDSTASGEVSSETAAESVPVLHSSSSPSSVNTSAPVSVFPGVLPADQLLNKVVRMQTDKGEIVLELYGETAPKAVSNFLTLTQNGFYNGLMFHRREEGFVIQGGDPKGNGTGGPGYTFEDELDDSYTYARGVLAMANRGPDTNGSQFFIMLGDTPLPKKYTIFGRVLSGIEVVDKIQIGDKMTTLTVESK